MYKKEDSAPEMFIHRTSSLSKKGRLSQYNPERVNLVFSAPRRQKTILETDASTHFITRIPSVPKCELFREVLRDVGRLPNKLVEYAEPER